jgi:hypothetical protein
MKGGRGGGGRGEGGGGGGEGGEGEGEGEGRGEQPETGAPCHHRTDALRKTLLQKHTGVASI